MRILPLLLFLPATSISLSAQDPVKIDPSHYHVLFENAHMRVLEYRDKPGDKAPMHSHPAYMTYVTGAGKTKIVQPNGETNVEDMAGSEFACGPPTQHATENVGNTPTQELLVEFKDQTNPCSAEVAKANTSSLGKEAPAKEEIIKVQDALIAAYIHRDTPALDRILADEYTFINDDAGGVVNKKQILDSFKSGGDREITSYVRQGDQVRLYGDVAVLTYRYQSTETYKGQENGGDFRVTRIFVHRDGRWQMVGGQETRVSSSQANSVSALADDAPMTVTAQQKSTKPKAESKEAKIARALSAGPANIAKAAKVIDRDENGKETVLREGQNGFTCFPGHPWVVDDIAYCANADALQWEADWHSHKPKPTNAQPGFEYMLAGGTYWSATDPYATSGTPFTEGPHWIILWPFDPATTGLPTQFKQTGTWIMWAGTPYSHLMINQRP